jgi:hypothetical protein
VYYWQENEEDAKILSLLSPIVLQIDFSTSFSRNVITIQHIFPDHNEGKRFDGGAIKKNLYISFQEKNLQCIKVTSIVVLK